MNLQLQPGIEGFVCNAELPSSSANIRLPILHLWKQPPLRKEEKKVASTPAEPTFPVIVQVYVGALSILGLYFIYRCAKR